MFTPGENEIEYRHHHAGGVASTKSLKVTYTPLTQNSFVQLAVLVTDERLISGFNQPYHAVSAELGVNAYVLQALIAEDMRVKGFGRRSFRLDEDWGPDTTGGFSSKHNCLPLDTIARVHVVHLDKPVATAMSYCNFGYDGKSEKFGEMLSYMNGLSCNAGVLPQHAVALGFVLDQRHLVQSAPRNLADVSADVFHPIALDLDIVAGFESYRRLHPKNRVQSCWSLQAHIFKQLCVSLDAPTPAWQREYSHDAQHTNTTSDTTRHISSPILILDTQSAFTFRRSVVCRITSDDTRLIADAFTAAPIEAWFDNNIDFSTLRSEDEPDNTTAPRDWLNIEPETGLVRHTFYDTDDVRSDSFDYASLSNPDHGFLGCRQISERITATQAPRRQKLWALAANGRARTFDFNLLRRYSDRVRVPGTRTYLHRRAVRYPNVRYAYEGSPHQDIFPAHWGHGRYFLLADIRAFPRTGRSIMLLP